MSQTNAGVGGIVDVNELWAVVPAAGFGTRLPSDCPKQYLELNGRCLLQRSIDTLTQLPAVRGVVVVLSKDDTLWSTLPASKSSRVLTTIGGASRAESVVAGVKLVCESAIDDNAMVMVHDAARAMTSVEDIKRLIQQVNLAPEHGGLLATKVQDTLKRAKASAEKQQSPVESSVVESTVNRAGLWQAQTPQMFRAKVLLASLLENQQAIAAGDITDEACAMENSGFAPVLVEALDPNFKITHARDLDMALALTEQREVSVGDDNDAQSGNAAAIART